MRNLVVFWVAQCPSQPQPTPTNLSWKFIPFQRHPKNSGEKKSFHWRLNHECVSNISCHFFASHRQFVSAYLERVYGCVSKLYKETIMVFSGPASVQNTHVGQHLRLRILRELFSWQNTVTTNMYQELPQHSIHEKLGDFVVNFLYPPVN